MPQGKQRYEATFIMNYSQQRGEKGSVMSEGVSENRTAVLQNIQHFTRP